MVSIECGYCERDLRGPHNKDCPKRIMGEQRDEIERLRAALTNAQGALSDYADATYRWTFTENSDIQSGTAIEMIDEVDMDTDLIRRCVERAEGWRIFKQDNGTFVQAPQLVFKWPLNDLGLEALAAQLVRMVDAIDTLHVMVGRRDTRIARAYEAIVEVTGPDRTENTLRACDEFFTERDNG